MATRQAKSIDKLTASELRIRMEKLGEKQKKTTDLMIEAGRGNERLFETFEKTDPLSLRVIAEMEAWRALNSEHENRYRYHGGGGPIKRNPAHGALTKVKRANPLHKTPIRGEFDKDASDRLGWIWRYVVQWSSNGKTWHPSGGFAALKDAEKYARAHYADMGKDTHVRIIENGDANTPDPWGNL